MKAGLGPWNDQMYLGDTKYSQNPVYGDIYDDSILHKSAARVVAA